MTDTNWLEEYLTEARGLCTDISCTTCGAQDFRRGIVEALSNATHIPLRSHLNNEGTRAFDPHSYVNYFPRWHLGRAGAVAIAKALAKIDPKRSIFLDEYAIRCLLYDLWSETPHLDDELQDLLRGTQAGEILTRMIDHHTKRLEKRRLYEASQDPDLERKRHEEKQREKQERHKKRIEAKKERDRVFYEKGPKKD